MSASTAHPVRGSNLSRSRDLVLATRSLFILRGTVLSGVARAGQRVVGVPGLDAPVSTVDGDGST